MKLFKRTPKPFALPKSWDEVTLEQLEEINEIKKEFEDNQIRISINSLAILMKRPISVVSSTYTLGQIYALEAQVKFMDELPPNKLVKSFKANGKKYQVNYDVSGVTASQFILMNHLMNKKSIRQNAEICAIFITEKGKPFDMEKHRDIAEDLYKHCPVSVIYPLSVFFCNLITLWSEVTKVYSQKEIITKLKDIQEAIQQTINEK